jgi:hypothetical protein
MKERFDFDVLTETQDRLAYVVLYYLATDGHGDVGSCGVAELDLMDLSAALDQPPGETLRQLRTIAEKVSAVCVEHEDTVLFAMAGADQKDFAHLYVSRGFEGLPPNLPKVQPRIFRS